MGVHALFFRPVFQKTSTQYVHLSLTAIWSGIMYSALYSSFLSFRALTCVLLAHKPVLSLLHKIPALAAVRSRVYHKILLGRRSAAGQVRNADEIMCDVVGALTYMRMLRRRHSSSSSNNNNNNSICRLMRGTTATSLTLPVTAHRRSSFNILDIGCGSS